VTTRNAPLQSEWNGDSKAQNSEKRKKNIFAPRAGQSADIAIGKSEVICSPGSGDI